MKLLALKSLLFLMFLTGCSGKGGLLPDGPVDEILGRNVTLKTLLDKPAYAFITWAYSDGKNQVNVGTVSANTLKISDAYIGRVSLNSINGFLTLGPLKAEDSGDYSITMIQSDGATQTEEVKLRVLEPVSEVAIKSDLAEAVEHNSTVVLTCSAKGSFLKFTWTNGTAPILADGKRLALKEAESSSTLTVAGVLRSDLVGPIYCTAANALETQKSAPFNLTVHYGPDAIAISPPDPPRYIRSGSNFSLTCSARSSPPATFTWHQDQDLLEAGGTVLTLETIQKLGYGKEMAGYACRAKNAKTQRLVSSPVVSFAVMDAIVGATITGPTAVLIAGNSSANLSCRATAGTVNTKSWLKDGQQLTASSRVVFAANMSSVSIDPLQKEDNGKYTCRLSNPVNTAEVVFTMTVNYGPETPTVTGEKAIEVNEPVSLVCSASSVPAANFTWKFNGTATDVKTAEYLIEKVAYKNTGTYTCEAQNAVTGKTSSYTHSLSVKEEGALDEGLSDGAIAGIVIAVLVALGIAIGLIFYCRQKVPVESPY